MKAKLENTNIVLTVGDITKAATDSIVNAANELLAPGGGVCGAIYEACGKQPFLECQTLHPKGTTVGQAVMTSGGRKDYKVIHAVGPIWPLQEPSPNFRKTLVANLDAAYWNALLIADEDGLKSVSFPSLATGIYAFPLDLAAETAFRSINEFVTETEHGLELVQFVLFSGDNYKAYADALKALVGAENVTDELTDAEIKALAPPRVVIPASRPKAKPQNFKPKEYPKPTGSNTSKKFGDNGVKTYSPNSNTGYAPNGVDWTSLFAKVDEQRSNKKGATPREDIGNGFTLENDEVSELGLANIYFGGELVGTVEMTEEKQWITDFDEEVHPTREAAINVVKESVDGP